VISAGVDWLSHCNANLNRQQIQHHHQLHQRRRQHTISSSSVQATLTLPNSQSPFVVELTRSKQRVLVERLAFDRHNGSLSTSYHELPRTGSDNTGRPSSDGDDSSADAAAVDELVELIGDAVSRRDNVAVDEFVDVKV